MPTEIETWSDTCSRTNHTGGVTTSVVSCNRSRVLQDNPHWRSRVRNGSDATTPFSATLNHYRSDPLFLLGAKVAYRNTWNGPIIDIEDSKIFGGWMRFTACADPTSGSYPITEANNQALKHFIQRANEVQRSIQGGVFLGELGEALRMIRNPARSLRGKLDTYLVDAKKRSIKASRSTSPKARTSKASRHKSVKNALSDSWLEASFGWLPLMSDVRDGAKALARLRYLQYQPIERISARGQTETFREEAGSSGTAGTASFSCKNRTVIQQQVQYKGGIKTSAPNARPFAEFGLTPQDFIPTVWELIPWSFVADYFTNIGDILEGYSYNRSNIAWCCKTTRRIAEKRCIDPQYTINAGPDDTVLSSVFWPGKPSWTRKEIIRTEYDGTFVPSFETQIPGMGTKWINLAALSLNSRSTSKFLKRLIGV